MEQRTCKICGKPLSKKPGPGRWPSFCSAECRNESAKRSTQNPCEECGEPAWGRLCQSCHLPSVWRARWPGEWIERTCSRCGVVFVGPSDGCSPACTVALQRERTARDATCLACGEPFRSKLNQQGWSRFCSFECAGNGPGFGPRRTPEERRQRERVRGEQKNRARRAYLARAKHEPYTLAEIAERDGFRCWLCNRRVNMSLKSPHPRSASVDHIVPLSKGGDDVRSNVRLAHLGENVRRGNRVEFAQQMLIG